MYNWVSNVRQFPLLSLTCKSCLQQITNLFAHSTAFESFAGEAAVDSVRLWVMSWCLTLLNGGRDVWSAETSTMISGTCFNMRDSSSGMLNCVGPPAFNHSSVFGCTESTSLFSNLRLIVRPIKRICRLAQQFVIGRTQISRWSVNCCLKRRHSHQIGTTRCLLRCPVSWW